METKEKKAKTHIEVILSFFLVDAEGIQLKEADIEVRRKGEQRPLTREDLVPITAGKTLGRLLAESSESFDGREREWYESLFKTNKVTAGKSDISTLRSFLSKVREKAQISNNVFFQIDDKLKEALDSLTAAE